MYHFITLKANTLGKEVPPQQVVLEGLCELQAPLISSGFTQANIISRLPLVLNTISTLDLTWSWCEL